MAKMPPGDEDPGDPFAGAELVHASIARNLQQGIAEKENARAEAVGRLGQPDVALHAELGETDVVAVQVGNEVEQDNQRHDAAADLAERAVAQFAEPCGLGCYQSHR